MHDARAASPRPGNGTDILAPHDSPLRSDLRPAEALSGPERDARIEQLLLAGLDAYFAGLYEQAINLWTRVLFLERQHDRARAYIERARSAQAERQRESEAVLHQGIQAFHDGDVVRARRLLTDALDRGAPPEAAHGMLDRIERLGAGRQAPARRPRRLEHSHQPLAGGTRAHAGRARGRPSGALLMAAAAGILAVGVWVVAWPDLTAGPIAGEWPFAAASSTLDGRATVRSTPAPLPLPAPSEVHLARAQAHLAAGRLRDAQRDVDRVPIGDPLRAAADRLRADIQRQLLAVAAAELNDSGLRTPRPRRPPPE